MFDGTSENFKFYNEIRKHDLPIKYIKHPHDDSIASGWFKPKKIGKEVLEKPDWETVVEMMYDKQLDCYDDEVIRVIYSKDKSKRYLILKRKNGILTYLLEYVYQFDDEEWNYISNQENSLPAMWEPYYTDWGVSHFEKEEELMNELVHEPEYKQFFT